MKTKLLTLVIAIFIYNFYNNCFAQDDCATKSIGNYCFYNNTKVKLSIQFYSNNTTNTHYYNQTITIQPGDKQCFYDLPKGAYSYFIQEVVNNGSYSGYSISS